MVFWSLASVRSARIWRSDRHRLDERHFQWQLRKRRVLDAEVDLAEPPRHRGQL